MLPDAVADALAIVIAEHNREWRLQHEKEMAEMRALLADTRRENAELRIELREAAAQAIAGLRNGDPGPPGPAGRDGVGFDDISVDYDGRRHFEIRFSRGSEAKAFGFDVPVMLWVGVWREGAYKCGDVVQKAGSQWVCTADTTEPPGDGCSAWTLSNRRGRDGKDGAVGPQGPEGRAGRDLTQMTADGTKYG